MNNKMCQTHQTLVENLKRLRSNAGLTQAQVAQELGVNPVTISGWERGSKQPDFATMEKLAELYHVSVPDLFVGSAPKLKTIDSYEDFIRCFASLCASSLVESADIEKKTQSENFCDAIYDRLVAVEVCTEHNLIIHMKRTVEENDYSKSAPENLMALCDSIIKLCAAVNLAGLDSDTYAIAVSSIVKRASEIDRNTANTADENDDLLPF